MDTASINNEDYEAFRKFLEEASGIVLGDNKHYLVASRLARLMGDASISSLSDLMKRCSREMALRQKIMDAMTTNETSWFRDNYPYLFLKEELFPQYSQKRANQIRIWSAACSTGQEPYSISMIISEYLMSRPGSLPTDAFQIVGTDISSTALELARQASYDNSSVMRGMSEERKKKFFKQSGLTWELSADVKSRVTFREMNLKTSYVSMGKFDVIFCRNVLIYFSTELKKDIIFRMSQALKPGGYLILGGSESISGYSSDFDLVRTKSGVVYQVRSPFMKVGS